MNKKLFGILLFSIVVLSQLGAQHQNKTPGSEGIRFYSAVQGASGKMDTILISNASDQILLSGNNPNHFKFVVDETNTFVKISYQPPSDFRGRSFATLSIKNKKENRSIELRGLSLTGLEGEHEASLKEIFEILKITTDPGWTSLANTVDPSLQGDELSGGLFRKSGEGPVSMIPLARYSPPSIIPFGYYSPSSQGPVLKQVGILSDSEKHHEHQTIYPEISGGGISFDPGTNSFGLYVVSPTHNSYSEDVWNYLRYPKYAGHAMRIYPVKDKSGDPIRNQYLVCIEEASNGDYQDYVFYLSNVELISPDSRFGSLLKPDTFTGWDIFLESTGLNSDPDGNFTIQDGIVHDQGKELGYMITEKSYQNYHFKLKFKWGEKKWPPRDQSKRDSGICYHIPTDEKDGVWPQSVECQIQEGDVGDFWLLGYCTIEVEGKQNIPKQYSQIVKMRDNERPNGEWNTVEVITFEGTCVHIVNGQLVNYGTNSSLRNGRILLQSEFAEIYYKDVEIREL